MSWHDLMHLSALEHALYQVFEFNECGKYGKVSELCRKSWLLHYAICSSSTDYGSLQYTVHATWFRRVKTFFGNWSVEFSFFFLCTGRDAST